VLVPSQLVPLALLDRKQDTCPICASRFVPSCKPTNSTMHDAAAVQDATERSTATTFSISENAKALRSAARFGEDEDVSGVLSSARAVGVLAAVLDDSDELSGNTALHMCAANGHVTILRTLLAAGTPIAKVNFAGSTALHYAAVGGAAECVEELLRQGAEGLAFLENSCGMTAFDEAQKTGNAAVSLLLKAYCDTTASTIDTPKDLTAATGNGDQEGDGVTAATCAAVDNAE
jgi:hypothetical protein